MPFDGIVVNSICSELNNVLQNGKINKISQPEKDTIIINIRTKTDNHRLLLSVNASKPRIHLTKMPFDNPATPPVFCMLLRKHIGSGKIIEIKQYDFERIVEITIDAVDELKDHSVKKLMLEMMGKHSNLILVNDKNTIIDSIKRINIHISRAREVLPGITYSYPPSHNKTPLNKVSLQTYITNDSSGISIENLMLNNIMGFGPLICNHICSKAGIGRNTPISQTTPDQIQKLQQEITHITHNIEQNKFTPCILTDNKNMPVDFYCFNIFSPETNIRVINSINETVDSFYTIKSQTEKLEHQKSGLSKIVCSMINKCKKKLSTHQEKLKDITDYDKLRLYGELIYANIYNIKLGQTETVVQNYYANTENSTNDSPSTITIPLVQNLSPSDNASLYFKKYNKAKSSLLALITQVQKTLNEIEYLVGVDQSIDSCENITEIEEIKKELLEQGIMPQAKTISSKKEKPSSPMKYISSDGFTIFIGKNNKQNDLLTLNIAKKNDIWLHTQKIPGSHVIIKTTTEPIPDTTIIEAAQLAAYYSRARNSTNVPVDYTEVKNVKKPSGAKPGMVIYNNFNTLMVSTNEHTIEQSIRID